MSLDLHSTARQITDMASELLARQRERAARFDSAVESAKSFTMEAYRDALSRNPDLFRNLPVFSEPPSARYAAPPAPEAFTVIASDGSSIDIDRHLPVRCFLINTGIAHITYGPSPDAALSSSARLYATREELVIRDIETGREHPIDSTILVAKRAVEEMTALVQASRALPDDTPALALVDGTLFVHGVVGQSIPDFVPRELIDNGFAKAVEEMKDLADGRNLALASYISMPGSPDVVRTLRAMSCPFASSDSEYRCNLSPGASGPCEGCMGGIADRDLFAEMLAPGERTAIFHMSSQIIDRHYRGTGLSFFYLNAGEEIGRVEVPSWVACDPALVGLVHSLVLDQCNRGIGYPVALMEAHEQAVVNGADRTLFRELIERELYRQGMPVFTSEKNRSKRLRWT